MLILKIITVALSGLLLFCKPEYCLAQKNGSVWILSDSIRLEFKDNGEVVVGDSYSTRFPLSIVFDSTGKNEIYAFNDYEFLSKETPFFYLNGKQQKLPNNLKMGAEATLLIPSTVNNNTFWMFNTYSRALKYDSMQFFLTKITLKDSVLQFGNPLKIADEYIARKIHAIRSANGKDFVIHTFGVPNNNIYSFSFINDTIRYLGSQKQGSSTTSFLDGGDVESSENGTKIVTRRSVPPHIIDIFDYDRCCNLFHLKKSFSDATKGVICGYAVSANGTCIYAVDYDTLYQYKIFRNDNFIRKTVSVFEQKSKAFAYYTELKRGPNNKIYISKYTSLFNENPRIKDSTNQFLTVINEPDKIGKKSKVDNYGVYLNGKVLFDALPNIPNYQLGKLQLKDVVKAGADDTICFGDTTWLGEIFAHCHTKYQWNYEPGLSSDTAALPYFSPWVEPTQPTVYRFVLTATGYPGSCWVGETVSDTVYVTVLPRVDSLDYWAYAGKDTIICEGESLTLGGKAFAEAEYEWTPGSYLSNPLIANPIFTAPAGSAGKVFTYTLVSEGVSGILKDEYKESTIRIRISERANDFNVKLAGNDTFVCIGAGVKIGKPSKPGVIYRWEKNKYLLSETIAQPTFRFVNKITGKDTLIPCYLSVQTPDDVCWQGKRGTDTVMVLVKTKWYQECWFAGIAQPESMLTNINIYPSPANDEFVVEYTIIQEKNVTLSVYNTLGQRVFSDETPPHTTVPTQNWPAGVYICKFEVNNQIITRKLVISR